MYECVLVPTDGTEGPGGPIQRGIELARTTGARVHALYVVDSREFAPLPDSQWLLDPEGLEERGDAAVEDVLARADSAGVEATSSVVRGVPHRAIVDAARARDADLIVMGTHGRTGIDRVLQGSVAERVVRTAPVPVLVVQIGEEVPERSGVAVAESE